MKSASRHILIISNLAFLLVFGLTMTAEAQNREKYLISAKAGGINLVSGNVTVERKSEIQRPQALTLTDDLQTGDSVTTGAGGRVEVLLNPGSYMRVDERSEFELTDASLDQLLVKLVKGSAVVEVTGADDVELSIGINTPQADAVIIKGGIYRFNVLPNGTTEILARKGRVLFGKGATNKIKGGQKVIIGRDGSVVEIAKLNKKEQDSLDLWSKERAETLARANQKLQRRPLLTAFNDWDTWNGWGQTSSYGTVGLWVYSSTYRSYCFLPVGSRAWSSPYGHRYGNGFGGYYGNGYYDWRRGYGNQPSGNGYPTTGGGSTGGGSTAGGGNVNPAPAPQPQPVPQPRPTSTESQIERGPRREYTTQSPN